ncbi:MAG: Arc family DNA-binding protein [Planctomycetota bacterium]|jgi:predicted transcriptional regulator
MIPLWYYIPMETRLDEIAFSIRLPPGLHQQLKEIAEKEKRSMNKTVILAIEMWLKAERVSVSDVKKELFRE